MAINYDKIREANVKKYGDETHHLALLGTLYSDRTHFLFELLQNAEDAGARQVFLDLHEDHLEVYHDGRHFTLDDVRGICGVADGTKARDLTKIGRFGIGFKSVYAYTDAPEIHCGPEHFRIEHFVRPYSCEAKETPNGWTTRFHFPFRHEDEVGDPALEIGEKLRSLNACTLLFLRSVEHIEWNDERGNTGRMDRSVEPFGSGLLVRLEEEAEDQLWAQEWLLFSRALKAVDGAPAGQAQVAYCLDVVDSDRVVIPVTESELVVFFPTEKETHLGYLIQGPFRTTPARDNIPKQDFWNRELVKQIAQLTVQSLEELKTLDLLTVDALGAMPLEPGAFSKDSMFRPIYDAVREALKSRDLLPAETGGFISANQAAIARGAELAELFHEEFVSETLGRPVRWLSTEITEHAHPELYHYLAGRPTTARYREAMPPLVVGIEVAPETLLRRLTKPLLEAQADEWVAKLYSFLASRRGLLNIARTIPMIRLADGTHVSPVSKGGTPNAYLSEDPECGFPVVKPSLVTDFLVRHMLQSLGLREPNLVEEVLRTIVPRYQSGKAVTERANRKHIKTICAALHSAGFEEKRRLIAAVEPLPLLLAVNGETGETAFMAPYQMYVRSQELDRYFAGNDEAWFLHERYDSLADKLVELGVDTTFCISARRGNHSGQIPIHSEHGWHVRAVDHFDPDCTIHGLEFALEKPTFDRAEVIWNHLLPQIPHLIRGVLETSTRSTFTEPERREMWSKAGTLLTSTAWLPDIAGRWHKPEELSLDDLPESFERWGVLAEKLGMRTTLLSRLAEEMDLEVGEIELLLKHKEECLEYLRLQQKDSPTQDISPQAYRQEFNDVFQRAGTSHSSENVESVAVGRVRDPRKRRERIAAEIEDDLTRSSQRLECRFRRVPERKWEGKDPVARAFLREQYGGRCQICGSSFRKRNGEPYFEGLYLVSRTKAQWIDRPGNIVCLCATCCAKFAHGSVVGSDLLGQVEQYCGFGVDQPALRFELCGEQVTLKFTEKHWVELEALLKAEPTAN